MRLARLRRAFLATRAFCREHRAEMTPEQASTLREHCANLAREYRAEKAFVQYLLAETARIEARQRRREKRSARRKSRFDRDFRKTSPETNP